MKIAFWNIHKKELSDILVEFVNERQIDILILAETYGNTVLEFIKKQKLYNSKRIFNHVSNGKIDLLSIYSRSNFTKENEIIKSPRWESFLIEIPTTIKLNLFCIHFHSKVNWSEDSLALECVNLAQDIKAIEAKSGNSNTILIGDFNMNPYESGLVAANGLHALPDLNHISKKANGRIIDGIEYKYLYNPMWNFFGNNSKPFGTYYYREPGHVSKEWNIYDQIIFRPNLSKLIKNNDIKIVDSIGGKSLVSNLNRPNRSSYSDHLPILLKIKI